MQKHVFLSLYKIPKILSLDQKLLCLSSLLVYPSNSGCVVYFKLD